MRTKQYNREAAVAYAHRWAFSRNPKFYDFENIGGDCTNFASQVLYAGGAVMNTTPTVGWYYFNLNNRAPAWTGVEYLHRFLVNNRGIGPVAEEVDISLIKPGDIVQLSMDGVTFTHSPVVVSVGTPPSASNILVAAHTFDTDNRPLNTYIHPYRRYLHITHVNIQ